MARLLHERHIDDLDRFLLLVLLRTHAHLRALDYILIVELIRRVRWAVHWQLFLQAAIFQRLRRSRYRPQHQHMTTCLLCEQRLGHSGCTRDWRIPCPHIILVPPPLYLGRMRFPLRLGRLEAPPLMAEFSEPPCNTERTPFSTLTTSPTSSRNPKNALRTSSGTGCPNPRIKDNGRRGARFFDE